MLRRTTHFAAATDRSLTGIAAALLFAVGLGCSSSTTTETGIGGDTGVADTTTEGGTDASTCPAEQTLCGSSCTNTKFDPNNCGGCGTACKAGEVCNGGTCASTCTAPLLKCGDKCTDPTTDENNCGSCGTKCVEGEVCGPKGCATSCPSGLTACDKACYDTKNDPKHCGDCTTACATGEVCVEGKCASTCSAPLTKCGSTCTNTDFDPNHCGKCDNKCGLGVSCTGGSCGVADKTDDDGDGISNFHEGKTASVDTDKDGKADHLDDDSDGDGILDKDEAGDTDVTTPPVDSDGDGKPDFQDTDSDNDGLSDADEKTKHGTSPTKSDTDGDGYTDFEEIAAGTDPKSATSNPGTIGGFSFDLPYKGLPRSQDLTFKPKIAKADVAFLTDTTGSMGGVINNIKSQLNTIASSLKTDIPDTAFGVGDFKDFPVNPYGENGTFGTADWPFRLRQRITTVLSEAQAGVNAMSAAGGNDAPESHIEALYQAATGVGFFGPGTAVWTAKFDPTSGYDATKHGTIGGMGFRKDAAPIMIVSTDVTMHLADGDTVPWLSVGGAVPNYNSTTSSWGTQKPAKTAATVAALKAIGAKVMGITTAGDTTATGQTARHQLQYFALQTGAYIAADAAGNCKTGVGGSTIAGVADPADPSKKVCPLVYSASLSGTGVSTAVIDAIKSFTSFVSFKTIWVEPRDNAATATTDESKFFVRAVPVSFVPKTGCSSPVISDLLNWSTTPPKPGTDGTFDAFTNVCPGMDVTFTLVLQNKDVPATCSDQVFSFKVIVIGDSTTEADSRVVTVRVPGDKTLCK